MALAAYPFTPWCGSPPDPAWIWRTWRLDPLVLALLVILFVWLARLTTRCAERQKSRRLALLTSGWVIGTLALVSPLCPLSVALFSARASQHVLLTMVAAPLVATGLAEAFKTLLMRQRGIALVNSPLMAAFVFAVVVWFWHTPGPYVFTFDNAVAYWAMHITMFASATWLWLWLTAARTMPIETILASLVSTVQMGFLGAFITLSPRPLYAPHLLTTDAWGFTPLEDQQLGGAIMWVSGCVIFLLVSIFSLRLLLRSRSSHPDRSVNVFGQSV